MNYTKTETHRIVTIHHSISTEQLRSLATNDHFPSLTIYVPTFRKGTEVKANSVQIENILKESAAKLLDLGMQEEFISQFLQPGFDLAKDYELMQHLYEGTAIFISLSDVSLFTLPCSFNSEIYVDNIFNLKQILVCEATNPEFYLLHITENSVQLFNGNNMELRKLSLPEGIPNSMDERFDLEERGMQTQSHPVATNGEGMLRGNIPLKDVEDKFIKKFVQDVANGIADKFFPPNSTKPLLFAGNPTITAMFKDACNYKGLLDQTITGNYEQSNNSDLHPKALEILNPWLDTQNQLIIDRYVESKGRDITSSNIAGILPAAYTGAVSTLLVGDDAKYTGSYDLVTNNLNPQSDTEHDLINEMVVQTILQNGQVIIVPRSQMPDSEDAVAILRFPMNLSAN